MKPITISLFTFLLLLSSCVAYQSGGMSANETSANFVFEDFAIGEARSNRFLLLGGMRKDALLLEAKRDLQTSRPLQTNEAYNNFTYDYKNSFIFGVSRTKVTVTADVIRYTDATPVNRYSETYKNKVLKEGAKDSLFAIGDSVYTQSGKGFSVLSVHNEKKCRLLFSNAHDEIKIKRISKDRLFRTKGNWKNVQVGENFQYYFKLKQRMEEGVLVRIGASSLLIRTTRGELIHRKIKEITISSEINPK